MDSRVPRVPEPGGPSRPSEVGAPRPEMHPSPPEADGGLRGPPDDADGGGKDGGQAHSNTDVSVKDNLSQTIVKLDRSVKGRAVPLSLERTESRHRHSKAASVLPHLADGESWTNQVCSSCL